jgi:putative copper export protein
MTRWRLEIRTLAADIALTEQAQIGQMQGWLSVWGLAATGSEPAMTWMGHPTEGRMPGMAGPEEIDNLQKASPEEADALFLQLMISHHQAAVPMAQAGLESTNRPEVQHLASAIVTSQQAEIETMQGMIQERSATASDETETPIYSPPSESQHGAHAPQSLINQETAASIAHGTVQGATVFLVGLVAFMVFVWLPTSGIVSTTGQEGISLFVRWTWGLFGLLAVAGIVEISLYGVRASGEPFSLRLLEQALFDTRVGHVWLIRLGLGLLTAVAVTRAVRSQRRTRWWDALGVGSVLLVTLTLTSHAAAEGKFLPVLADWLHLVAVSLWMGGLLGFPLVLMGPLRAMPAKQRRKLLCRAVRRFSRMAILAVIVVVITGAYAVLLHVPSMEGLLSTAYGQVLMVKLGLVVLLLVAGSISLVLDGREPFRRVVGAELILAITILVVTGFLTSLPPATDAAKSILDRVLH